MKTYYSLRQTKLVSIVAILVLLASWTAGTNNTQAATSLTLTNGSGGQGTNAWTNPSNAQGSANNNTYATASPANNARVSGIWNTYNFDSNLPLHAQITKVEIIAQYNVSSTLSTANLEVQAVVNGSNCPASPAIDSSEPTSDSDFIVDVTSCRSWTRADLLNASLGTRVTAHRANLLFGVTFNLDFVTVRVTYNTPDYEQAAYRWYDNADSTSVGPAIANQNTAPTLYAPRDRIRLRVLLHVSTTSLLSNSEQFKLQFAQKTGASCSGLTYSDVTASSLIAYYNNPTPANGTTLSIGGQDPSHSGHTIVAQTYSEASPFSTLSNVSVGQDGMWDISLVGNGALANTIYCFRMVTNGGAALTTYTTYPEILTSPIGSLNIDIVDALGASVSSPSFSFSSIIAPIDCSSTSATFGNSSQRIRVQNTTDTPSWTLSIAATGGSTSLWSAGTLKYDYNDNSGSPSGCAAGTDSDTYAGQMSIDASGATITPRSVCDTNGVSKGALASFVENSINSITLMSASGSADIRCYYDLQNVGVTQRVPGGQYPGSYSINLTLTVVAS